ncbi:leukocyte receptor cluster member 8 homolog isoform X1 [Schistocerca piceifrons]|uniref:leukocyte receptor cluster member 8 homolog isoform X1 n=1 Tax=Schistocerca piceifrons TaxID=274613 RepID=UPI001F5FA509|nr:leukocyte receptor cluster member 8 homolog isoform X1 [Schistocerca piceifrons]XP_047113691.1 leukocyte receptor cluster member 8 homolog isoform X1 [Schistocerca piceifrons]XP_047113692.1 leukocyte receptor cluster member 8 homolog isoform X1 [Schistocerca piceifrons]XP_047113693.1 leukocyte receptor cluster member 8 homolog isoform X1 [Schistocerca piceifrons]
MAEKTQTAQMSINPWQYPPQYGMYNPYAGQAYGHPGYGHPGPYFYYNSNMGYSHSVFDQNAHHQIPPSTHQDFRQEENEGGTPGGQASPDENICGQRNEMPPLPPGPPPPANQNYLLPTPPASAVTSRSPQFYNQPGNTTYGPIKFSLPNKKPGIGFKPFNNSGASKKKRKNKNKKNAQNLNNSLSENFMPSSPGGLMIHPPPLPPGDNTPLFPPLPPEPAPPSAMREKSSEEAEVTNVAAEEDSGKPFSVSKTLQERASAAVNHAETHQYMEALARTAQSVITGEWPESLKNYINRCYDQCIETVDKDRVEIILKGKITRAASEGTLWTKNWDVEPLPSIHTERNVELKKTFPTTPDSNVTPTVKMTPIGRGKKPNLSAALGSRLGARCYRNQRRSRSRSRSHSRSRSRSRSKSHSPSGKSRRNRSRSRDSSRSKSPARRRRRSGSSSSSDDNFKSLKVTSKVRATARIADRLNMKNRNLNKGKIGKAKQNNKLSKSHFYSEFGSQFNGNEDFGSSERLQQRAARFSSNFKESEAASPTDTPQRKKKPLSLITTTIQNNLYFVDSTGDPDLSSCRIVGTCQDIEKPYLRLTSAPHASAIRPVEVLKQSLQMVKDRWINKQDYRYACDQMKSIRQDLTVQGIRDEFTVQVYETHARIALEKGDHEEFNQCQTQLKMLYSEIGGQNKLEFTAYRILYYIYTKNTLDLTTILASLTPIDEKEECVSFALAVRSAWWLGNYHKLFQLYREAPMMTAYLMDWFADRERKSALKSMVKSYRPFLPVSLVTQELAFESDEKCLEFLTPFGLKFDDAQRTKIDCKTSSTIISNI